MATSNHKLYRFHVKNIHSIEIALNNSALAARKAIAEQNKPAIESFVSLNSFLLGAWTENRLRKLLHEEPGLSDAERALVKAESSQLEKWKKLIEVAFRKHYTIPHAELNESNLPFTAAARYKVLNEILGNDLRSVIELRNKLAHGQWFYPLNSEETGVEADKFNLLRKENLPSLQYKKSLITSLTDIIHDLVVSPATFERDFDKNYKRISNTRNNLNTRNYENYCDKLVEKRIKGVELRKSSTSTRKMAIKTPCLFLLKEFLFRLFGR
ncbi:hypothetical protein [Candidatus Methylospira mobilis]|uniref:hypothetical protein n=1 Tax=Candidatus Methylospira mobilis TaxID=1808979 RepID=UPI001884B6DA|nr:hypothetical protein [Candidatus Methylospira mobilis]